VKARLVVERSIYRNEYKGKHLCIRRESLKCFVFCEQHGSHANGSEK